MMRYRYLTALMLPMICLGLGAQADQRYTVQEGDNLSALSERFYDNAWSWRLIYRANRDKVFNGGNLIETGTVLVIPDATGDAKSRAGSDSRVSMARPATLLLDGGQAFFGTIVGATAESILIRRGVRTFRLGISKVKEVRLENINGGVIAGELLSWSNGVVDLRADNFRLGVRDGEIISARVLPRGDVDAPLEALPSVTDVVIGDTPVIRLDNGKEISGYIVDFKGDALTVRRGARGSNRIKLADVAEVQIPTPGHGVVTGELVDWADGIYRLQANDRTIVARENVVPATVAPTAVADLEVPPVKDQKTERQAAAKPNVVAKSEEASPRKEPLPAPGVQTRAVSIQSVRTTAGVRSEQQPEPKPEPEPLDNVDTAERETGIGGDFIPITQLVPKDGEAILVQASALPAFESDEALRFQINLSRAPDEKLVIVYASVNGTATSGQDYEKNFGVLDILPGETSAFIDLPLNDDDLVEPDESVHLFISPDPSRAEVEARDIVGIIQDDDG